MNLLDASKLVRREHVQKAVRKLKDHTDFEWLYQRTGREEPDHRYVVVNGLRYPSKAFGFLVAQIAGNTKENRNQMNVNQAVAPLIKLGFSEVRGPSHQDNQKQQGDRRESYYKALARPQQAAFRRTLVAAYGEKCVISGCTLNSVLEAAHVVPFRAKGGDTLGNGILLRIDLHRLFDADEIAINPESLKVVLSKSITGYIDGLIGPITMPEGGPRASDFKSRWKAFNSKA